MTSAANTIVRKSYRRRESRGFTILEVILALAILLTSLAAIGQLVYNAYRNAARVRDLTRAQLIAEAILAQLNAGALPLETVADAPVEDIDDTAEPGWLYTVDIAPLELDGLLSVQVIVAQDPSMVAHPVQYSLTQWMLDPTMEFTQPGEQESAGTMSAGSAGSGSGSAETSNE